MTRFDIKKVTTAAAISGALGCSALGLGAGIASADPVVPKTSPTVWSQDGGGDWDWHGHGHGHDGDWGPRWGDWGPGPVGWPGGCAAGTIGVASGQVCL
jgi:hypothetical protein